MSTDLQIDLFSRDLFDALWKLHGIARQLPAPEASHFDAAVLRAVQVRQAMFGWAHRDVFEATHAEFAGRASSFFAAIADFFPHYPRAEDPESVMCAFLSSCAFVADMCAWCEARGDAFARLAHEAWAMFADMHLKDLFYAAGGWRELRKFAHDDLVVYDFMRTFNNADPHADVLLHSPHLTCGAIDSFHAFEEWEGVGDDAPYALKWVDYCVHVPFKKVRNFWYFSQGTPDVFNALEAAIWSLNMILDPTRGDDSSDDEDGSSDDCYFDAMEDFPKIGVNDRAELADEDGDSDATEPCHPRIAVKDQGGLDEDADSDATEPRYTRIAIDDKMGLDEDADSDATEPCYPRRIAVKDQVVLDEDADSDATEPYYPRIAVKDQVELYEDADSDATEPCHPRIAVKDKVGLDQDADSDATEPYYPRIAVKDQVELYEDADSDATEPYYPRIAVKDQVGLDEDTDSDATEPHYPRSGNANPESLETIITKSSLKKRSEFPTSNSQNKVEEYLKTLYHGNPPALEEGAEKNLNSKVLSPCKAPLASTTVCVLNTPDGILYKRLDSSGSGRAKRKRSGGKENCPSRQPKTDDNNMKQKHSTCKSDTESKGQKSKENLEDNCAKMESIPPCSDQATSNPISKIQSSSNSEAQSTKDDLNPLLPENIPIGKEQKYRDELTHWSELENKTNFAGGNSLDDRPTHPENLLEDNARIIPLSESLPKTTSDKGLNSLKCMMDITSSQTRLEQTCSGFKTPHGDWPCTKNENNLIFERSVKLLEPAEDSDMPRSSMELSNHRRTSNDSTSTETCQIYEGSSSAEPTCSNQPSSEASSKQLQNLESTSENPIDGQKTKTHCPTPDEMVGMDSPEDSEKKRRKRKPRKRLSRLQERVKEEGNAVYDVARLILVMGHPPGVASVASANRESKAQDTPDV